MAVNETDPLYKLRHTAAHVLAMAALEFDPKVKLAIGPPIDNGFYYDFEFSRPISEADLATLESLMAKIIKQDLPVEHKVLSRAEAIKKTQTDDQPYKQELIEDLPDKELSYYGIGDFWDLCKGPHVKKLGEIKAFKLLSLAGAYWRGSEANQMLTRIYGTAWPSDKEQRQYLAKLEEAKKRDHRKLGKDLEIFTILPEIGSGLPVWLPNGASIYRELVNYIHNIELEAGYQHVITSVLGRSKLYETSGHLDHYADSMYPPIKLDGETFYLRPMNCPHHIAVFQSTQRSYRQLPLRIAEFGEVFRLEKSGELSGLQRVRAFTINDAHIFCSEDSIGQEFKNVVTLIQQVYAKLGIGKKDYWFRLSLHDENNKAKYGSNMLLWEKSESVLRQTLKDMKVDFVEAKDEAAFYGPKLDVQMKNVLGKDETISTVQLDFHLPAKFDLEYINDDGQKQRPVMIHRAILGSMERFIGILIEHTAGEFPFWLSPVQVAILPVSDKAEAYSREVANELRKNGFRVELSEASESLGKRIRASELKKIPRLLVVGEQEARDKTVTLRVRHTAEQTKLGLAELVSQLEGERRG